MKKRRGKRLVAYIIAFAMIFSMGMTDHLRLYWIRTSCKRYKYERHFYEKVPRLLSAQYQK